MIGRAGRPNWNLYLQLRPRWHMYRSLNRCYIIGAFVCVYHECPPVHIQLCQLEFSINVQTLQKFERPFWTNAMTKIIVDAKKNKSFRRIHWMLQLKKAAIVGPSKTITRANGQFVSELTGQITASWQRSKWKIKSWIVLSDCYIVPVRAIGNHSRVWFISLVYGRAAGE